MKADTLPFDEPAQPEPSRREKSPDAFRTISEVAEELETPAHVLRFWETKFSQLSPLKRGGGRRYYRPADVALLQGIRRLLYEEGLTIKGLQKLIRERGVKYIAACGEPGATITLEETAEDAPAAAGSPDLGALIARLEAVRDKLRA